MNPRTGLAAFAAFGFFAAILFSATDARAAARVLIVVGPSNHPPVLFFQQVI